MNYTEVSAVNISTLVEMRRSPMHYRHAVTVPRPDTDALRFGRLFHAAVLEPDEFIDRAAVWEGGRRAGNSYAAWVEANDGKTLVTSDDMATIEGMSSSVRRHVTAASLLAEGKAEHPIFWESGDVACKSRLDWITPDGVIVDLKSTRDCSARPFARAAADYDMHVRAAFYCDAYEFEYKRQPVDYVLIAVEKTPPYACATYSIDKLTLAYGKEEYLRLLALLRECRAKDEWPGPGGDTLQPLELPPWAAGMTAELDWSLGG